VGYIPYVFSGSAALFDQAKYALKSMVDRGVAERQHGQWDALVAIVFSAMTLEAFINEFGDLAASPLASSPENPASINMAGTALKELAKSRAPVQLKYLWAKWILSGQQYDKGIQPYQDFKILIDVRNEIVHIKRLDLYEVTPAGTNPLIQPPFIESLDGRGILADVSGVTPEASWMERLQCLVSARWAFDTTANMIDSLIAATPDSPFRMFWRGHQRKHYDLSEPPVAR
jgi:hypothetical protein